MNLKKGIVSVVSAVTLLSCVSPSASFASTRTNAPTVQVSKEQVANMKEVFDVVKELDRSNLNMDNLSKNKQKDINKLSSEAKKFYYIYAEASKNGKLDAVQTMSVLHTYYNAINNIPTNQAKSNVVMAASIRVKTYKLTNQQVKDIGKLIGVHGAGWGLAVAIAKKFGKSPTLATALIIAVPALGWAVLNACNRYSKGVILKDIRIGATHNWSCSARR
ncbi:hypothetical protein D0469_06665 [Peribacillus saganii]|uniref:Uncharacterized protein n=1 Tax=Peribacillus saganii TaxID=2303992 RepID=A0A372LQS9_9BACI|nr:hypothetical protein [Peribacillus saganii]RFU70277.1 hypothetical protein D0469_06665 [Peribacillus saganii]